MIGRTFASAPARPRFLDGLFPGAGERQQRLFRAIGQFLTDHRLEPTPANYAVGHAYVTRSDAAVVALVEEATYGDIRLSQANADRMIAILCTRATPDAVKAAMAEIARSIDDARERFERYAGIVDGSRADAQAYGAVLADGAATLAPVAPGRTDAQADAIATLVAVTQQMIDKTQAAEGQLRAASLEMADLRASLAEARQDAETDALTGLPNRRAFEAEFARRGDATMALAMCDIDRFKAINDRHGHDVGDRVIRLVARELDAGCGDATVARYGGEEFVALFLDCDADAATRVLDVTRASISRRAFRVTGTDAVLEDLSFSGGVVSVLPGEAVRDAVRRADAALYRAKQGGRNRIESDG